jgi:hypothetical protein
MMNVTLSFDLASPEAETFYQAFSRARERYRADQRIKRVQAACHAMCDQARKRWADWDAFLASLSRASATDQLEILLSSNLEAAQLSGKQRDALRTRLREDARVFAFFWMRALVYTAAQLDDLSGEADIDAGVLEAERGLLQTFAQEGIDPVADMRVAYGHLLDVLLRNRKLNPGGCFDCMVDAAAKMFAECLPDFAPSLTKAFREAMTIADNAFYESVH